MGRKKTDYAVIVLFSGFLAAMQLGMLLLPPKDFSEFEKRYLTVFPAPSAQSVLSGAWGSELETYLADHLPGRNFFVGLNAYYDRALGLQPTKEIRIRDERLIEAPADWNEEVILSKMDVISRFADTVGQEVSFALVPSCGWALGEAEYPDEEIICTASSNAGKLVQPILLTDVFRGKPDLYYRTDHHWNSRGAYTGYQQLMSAFGREYLPESAFTKEVFHDSFQGSTYSRSALWLTKPEDIELWHGTDGITVENKEAGVLHDGVFYTERLEQADKYTVFLDGNHSLVTLRNPEKEGKLLVIRDSFSNALGCFLAESYGEVVLVDMRYYKSPVSALAAQGFDDILVCYSVGNFMTDISLLMLR